MMGLEQTHLLPTASTLCGACGRVCPVKIPIPELLIRLREGSPVRTPPPRRWSGRGAGYSALTTFVWRMWARVQPPRQLPGLQLVGQAGPHGWPEESGRLDRRPHPDAPLHEG